MRSVHGDLRTATGPNGGSPLSSDLDDGSAVPYLLRDEPMTVAELQERLRTASVPERHRLLARILPEARSSEVWRFTTSQEVAGTCRSLSPRLGRRKGFWEYIPKARQVQGRVTVDWSQQAPARCPGSP
jgi:hypothetical protein